MDRPADLNAWERVLAQVRTELDAEDSRRWFASTSDAGDSGDQIIFWIESESHRRHIETHYRDELDRALESPQTSQHQHPLRCRRYTDDEGDDTEARLTVKVL